MFCFVARVRSVSAFCGSLEILWNEKNILPIIPKNFTVLCFDKSHYRQSIKNYELPITNAPFEVPEGWVWVRLQDIVTILGDGIHGTPKYSNNDEFYFINGNNLENGKIVIRESTRTVNYIEYEKYKKDLTSRTVLVSINGTLGNIAFYNQEKVILGKSACYFNVCNNINLSYIKCIIESNYFRNYANEYSTGSTIKNVSLASMRELLIPLPPLLEQHRIVCEIERCFALIDTIETSKIDLQQFIKQTKQKVLDLAIRGKLAPQNPDDEPASALLERIKSIKNDKVRITKKSSDKFPYPFKIPESWGWCRLGEINEIARGGSPRPIKNFLTDTEDGINWIKIGDAEKGGKYIYSTKEKIIKEGIRYSRFVSIDDFLLTNSMSFGRPYILKTDGCIHDGWLVISINKDTLNADFMYYLLSSDYMFSQFYNSAVGSTVKNLKIDTVQLIPFPLPPLAEQQRIVQKIETIFERLETLQDNL